MKVRPPVDFNLVGVDQIAPSPQGVLRYAMCAGIGLHAQTARLHRFNVHRPARLNGSAAEVVRHWSTLLAEPLPTFLTTQFRTCLQRLSVDQGLLLKDPRSRGQEFAKECDNDALMAYGRCLRPALYSSLRSSPSHPTGVSALRVTIAIANARKQWGLRRSTAKSRRLFRNQSATSRRLRAGAIRGSTAMTRTAFCRKSPRVPRVCRLGSWALGTSDRENTRTRRAARRDKRGSPIGPQAIDMAWVLACRSVGARAAPCVFMNAINNNFGTVAAFHGPEAWQ